MTRDEFDSQYRLLGKTGGDAAPSSAAEHRATGRAVQVHFFDGGLDGPGTELLGLLERLTPADRSRVIEALRVDDSVVFVTQPLPEGHDFERWLRDAAIAASGSGPGEFTALFRAGASPPGSPVAGSPPLPPEPRPTAPAAGPSFTELFRSTPEPGPQPAAPPGRSATPPVRVVGVRLPTPPSAPITPQGPPIPAPRLGGEPARGPAAPPPPEAPVPRAAALYAPEPAASPPPQQAPWSGPSDFTRQLSPSAPFSAQVPAIPPPAASEPAARKASYLPLFLALNLAFIIITGLVIYFALRRC
jgi:hypothetical protein